MSIGDKSAPPSSVTIQIPSLDLSMHTTLELMTVVLGRVFPNYEWDDSADKTAERFVKFLKEYAPAEKLPFVPTDFDAGDFNGLVAITNVEYSSICKHHLLPFSGVAHVGYIPNMKIIGASKIPRFVHHWATRPQTQEYLTQQIADSIHKLLNAMGTAVVIEGQHTCMSCRGVRQVGALMHTSVMKGVFLTNEAARIEFMSRIK